MSSIGKGSLSLRKKDVLTSRTQAKGFTNVVFAHLASGGESSINLQSLVAPPDMLALGFVQPSGSLLADLNVLTYRQNLTLRSSVRGELTDYMSYVVASNSVINFIGFTLDPDEVITGTISDAPRDGLLLVDALTTVATGTLPVGQTDFAVGTPFEVNKYSGTQLGAVIVTRNGLEQLRCVSNNIANEGHYVEVPAGDGTSVLIRFKDAPANTPDAVVVKSNGMLVERPSTSTMAALERIAGQIDAMVPALADATGRPTTDFQTAPNDVDLLTFGNTVIDHESRISDIESDYQLGQTYFWQTSAVKTPVASGTYHAHTGNSVVLPAGTEWEITGTSFYTYDPSSPTYQFAVTRLAETNGNDTATVPTGLGTNFTPLALMVDGVDNTSFTQVSQNVFARIRVNVTAPIYITTYAIMTTPANARVSTSLYAKRVK